jgi:hypothetical protein
VVTRLGRTDGFDADPAIHIPLPGQMETIRSALAKVGMSQSLDDLELKLNRAAENATPKAKSLFVDAISAMTFDDVKSIYNGPEDSATRYFRGKMTPGLTREIEPVVTESLSNVGAIIMQSAGYRLCKERACGVRSIVSGFVGASELTGDFSARLFHCWVQTKKSICQFFH